MNTLKEVSFGQGDQKGRLRITRDTAGRIWAGVSTTFPAVVTIKLVYRFGPQYTEVFDEFHESMPGEIWDQSKRFPQEAWDALEQDLAEIQITANPN